MKKIKLFSVLKKEIPAQKYLMNMFDASEIEIVYTQDLDESLMLNLKILEQKLMNHEIFEARSIKCSKEFCQEIAQKVVKMAIDSNCNIFYCDTESLIFNLWANIYASGIFFTKTEKEFFDIQEDVGSCAEMSCVYFDKIIWKKIF